MLLAVAIRTLTGVFADKDNSAKQIWAAFAMVVLLIAVMAVVTVLMSKFLATSGNLKSGFAVAAGVVAMVAATVFIVMPMLEELVQDASKFPQYAAAVGIVVAALLGIGASFFLLTYGAGGKFGGIKILVAGFVFYKITQVIKNFIIPMIQEIAKIDTTTAIGSAVSIGLLVLLIGIAIERMLKGIASIVAELRRINAKTWISIILSMGAVIAAIVVLTHIFEDQGKELSIGSVLLVLGTFAALIIGFGVFAKMITKASNGDYNTMMGIVSILNSLSIFIGLLTAALVGTLAAVRYMFDGNMGDALTIMGSMALIILGTLAVSMFILMKAVESLGRSFKASRMANIDVLKDLIIATFISIAGLIVVLTTSAIVIKLVYKDTLGYLGTIATIVIGALLLLGGVFTALGIFLTKVPNYNADQDTFKMIVATFIGTFAMVAEITAAAIILHNVFSEGGMLGTVATVVGSAIVMLGGILLALGSFIHQVTTGHQDISNNEIAAISISLLSLIVLVGEVAFVLIPALEKIQNVPVENIAASLLGVSLIIAVILGMAAKIQAIGTVSIKGLVASMIGLAGNLLILSFALPRVFEAFNSFREVNVTDIIAGLAAIIVPFYVLTQTISAFAFSGVGGAFLIASAEIAGGLLLIAAAMAAIAVASSMLKDVFGLGETTFSIFNQGFKKEAGIKSPSRAMAKDGKFLAQGLGLGIKQSRRFLTDTSVAMAENFNEDFCDTLGIASPSKVFYENGRFVVRGFINGLGDESNKNKQAGADMADGFTSGMDDAIEKMKSEFGGIWDGLDINDEAEKAGEGLFDSFFNKFLGDDGEVLTEEEQKKYDELVKERNKMVDAWNRQNSTLQQTNPEEFAKQQAAYKDEITKTSDKLKGLAELETKIANKSAKSGGFASTLSSIFNGSLTDAFNNPELKAKIDGGLSDIGGKITGFFGIDSDFTKQIKDIFTGNNGVVNDVISKGGDKIKELLPDEVEEAINEITKDGGIESVASTLGDKIGQGIIMGISNALTFGGTPIQKLLDFISGKGRAEQIYNENQALLSSFNNDYLLKNDTNGKYKTFTSLLSLALKENDNIALTMEDLVNIFQEYKKMIDSGVDVRGINLTQTLLHMANAKLSSYSFDTNDLLSHASGQYQRYISNQSYVGIDELVHNIQDYIKQDNISGIASNSAIINTLKNIPGEYALNLGNALHQIFRNEDATLYSKTQIYDENGPTGKYNVTLTRKGAYLVNKLIELARKKQLGANLTIDSVKALTGDYDQQAYEKIDAFAENYGDITGDHYEYTESQMDEILNELIAMNVIDEDTGDVRWADLQTNQDVLDLWEEKLGGIRTRPDGSVPVTIVSDESQNKTKTTYDFAKAMVTSGKENSGINYLNDLSNKARANDPTAAQALMQMTNGLGYTGFMNAIQSEYDFISAFIGTKEFYNLSTDVQQGYRNKKAFYERYYGLGSNNAQGLNDGYTETLDDTEKDRSEAETRVVDSSKGSFAQASPSKVYYEMGKFNALGLQNGFLDYMDIFEKASVNSIYGLNDATSRAFEAMVDSLDDDSIQPTITPIFDDNAIQNGVTGVNTALNNFVPTTQATVNSFKSDTPNYNGSFASLNNQVAMLTGVVNSFMQLVAEGDIVNINVTGEVDTNNLYELIVNTNREKFKQTGKNKLMSY